MSEEKKKDPHRELCEIGAKFLKRPASGNGHGCHYAIIEPACYGENPDVFGVRHGTGWDAGTIVIEVKVGRGDFLKDKEKPHRANPETGLGRWRYYLCPTGLIQPHEVPEKWGLIYANSRGHITVIKGALGVPVQTYEGWNKSKVKFKPYDAVKQKHEEFSFEVRNVNAEVSLLTMALVRVDGIEDAQYAIRRSLKLEAEVERLSRKNNTLQNKVGSLERQLKFHKKEVESSELVSLPLDSP